MKTMLLIGFALVASALGAQIGGVGASPRRLFIEQRTVSYTNEIGVTRAQRNITLEVTREILKRCPNAISVTDKSETAEFNLRITPGSSTLYSHGDAVATFAARFRVGNLAKDVCEWIAANAASNAAAGLSPSGSPPAASDKSRNADDKSSAEKPAGIALKNGDVLALKQAGLSDPLIIEKIRTSAVRFDLDATDLVALKKSGLSDAVIAAMLEASRQ